MTRFNIVLLFSFITVLQVVIMSLNVTSYGQRGTQAQQVIQLKKQSRSQEAWSVYILFIS